MLEIVYHERFLKSAAILSQNHREKLGKLIGHLRNNPYNSLLHTKQLTEPLIGLMSFRITRDWRVLFRFIDERTVQLIRVAHRKDIYR
jgi:mRNA-degrading endonuclease RelE of RelBE toxin-antitoxin system